MHVDSHVPIITTPNLAASREFYARHLGFQVTVDNEHYVGLRAGPEGSLEIGFMTQDDDAPAVFDGQGVTFAFGVADADEAHRQLLASGAPIVAAPADKRWGARTVVTRDPNGVLIFISHPSPAALDSALDVR